MKTKAVTVAALALGALLFTQGLMAAPFGSKRGDRTLFRDMNLTNEQLKELKIIKDETRTEIEAIMQKKHDKILSILNDNQKRIFAEKTERIRLLRDLRKR